MHRKGDEKLPSPLKIESSGRAPEDLLKMGFKCKRGGEARRRLRDLRDWVEESFGA